MYTIQPLLAKWHPPRLKHLHEVLSSLLYIACKWFVTVEIKFNLYNASFCLTSAETITRTGLLSCGVADLGNSSVNILFLTLTSKKKKKKKVYAPHVATEGLSHPLSPALKLWPATYSLLIITFCCWRVAVVTCRHLWCNTRLPLCASQRK